LQDAQRALRIIRQREKQVSVLGFSAGGHLMGMAATRPDFRTYPARDEIDEQTARPDRAALIYPVITLEKPYTHTSTHKILVGPHANATEEAAWSVQNFVSPDTPPALLCRRKTTRFPIHTTL
jgi:acetyl esterase/lipase